MRRHCSPRIVLVLAALPAAQAQTLRIEPSLSTTLTATDNVERAPGDARSALVLDVLPSLQVTRRGPALDIDGSVALEGLAQWSDERSLKWYPRADLRAQLRPVPRLVSIDAGLKVDQAAASPFAARADGPSATRRLTVATARLGPSLQAEPRPGWLVQARADAAWTHVHDPDGNESRPNAFGEGELLRVERLPLPFGAGLEASRERVHEAGAGEDPLRIGSVRASVSRTFGESWIGYLLAGRESASVFGRHEARTLVGGRVVWRPEARTHLDASVARRFYGTGWTVDFVHRNPWLGLQLHSHQQPITHGSALTASTPTDLTGLLDAMFSTRLQDAQARNDAVREFVQSRHLDTSLPAPYSITSDSPQRQRNVSATVLLLGVRNTLSLSAYANRLERLAGAPAASADGLQAADRIERGAGAQFSHRLTPLQTVDLGLAHLGTRAVGAPGRSDEDALTLRWTTSLGPHTQWGVGLRWDRLRAQPAGSMTEHAVLAQLRTTF